MRKEGGSKGERREDFEQGGRRERGKGKGVRGGTEGREEEGKRRKEKLGCTAGGGLGGTSQKEIF